MSLKVGEQTKAIKLSNFDQIFLVEIIDFYDDPLLGETYSCKVLKCLNGNQYLLDHIIQISDLWSEYAFLHV